MIAAEQLAAAFGLGVGLGLLYDLYRVWFRRARRPWARAVGDIAWWLCALVVAAGALYYINGLALRGFTLALAAAGAVCEQASISPRFFPLGEWVCHRVVQWVCALGRFFRRAVECGLTPLVWLVELAFKLVGLVWLVACRVGGILGRPVRWLTAPVWRPVVRCVRRVKRRLAKMWLVRAQNGADEPRGGEESAQNP